MDGGNMEYYSALKREILAFVAPWINLENIMLNKINQAQRDQCHMFFFSVEAT
jgi:hypothetical protein